MGSRRRVWERDFLQSECFSAVGREHGEFDISGVRDQRVRLGRVLRNLDCSGRRMSGVGKLVECPPQLAEGFSVMSRPDLEERDGQADLTVH